VGAVDEGDVGLQSLARAGRSARAAARGATARWPATAPTPTPAQGLEYATILSNLKRRMYATFACRWACPPDAGAGGPCPYAPAGAGRLLQMLPDHPQGNTLQT